MCRLVLVSSRFCDSPAAVFISSRFVSPRACLVSLLSHHHFVSCRVCLVRSRAPSLLDSLSLGLLVSRCLISWSLGPWSLGLLISWSPVGLLISGALGPWVSWSFVYVLNVFTRVGVKICLTFIFWHWPMPQCRKIKKFTLSFFAFAVNQTSHRMTRFPAPRCLKNSKCRGDWEVIGDRILK